MCRLTFITFSFFLCERVLALSVDQRQTGDLNVQIDLKNFKVFALTKGKEEYVDYDYAYDYSEMTIKPQNGTTSTTIKPLNTTEALLLGNDNVTFAEIESTTKIIENNATSGTTRKEAITITMATNISSSTVATTISVAHGPPHSTSMPGPLNADNYTPTTTTPDCKKGFYRNVKGNCELKLQNPSNTLFKMLQQKTKGSNGTRKT